jgi:hypothetical protein
LDETLSWADSLLFPVLGSAVLLGLWVLLRYVDKKWINLVLGIYCESQVSSLRVPWPQLTRSGSLDSWSVRFPIGEHNHTRSTSKR